MSFQITRPIRALLVDDEELARSRLRKLLPEYSDFTVVGEAGDGEEALKKIREFEPDVVFLDIQMPGQSGMEVASNLPVPRPQLIFCTAFDKYALEAFENHAVDYILKPVSRRRLEGTIQRLRRGLQTAPSSEDLRSAEETQARLFPQRLPETRGLDYFALCRPARGVGGDYYDFLNLGKGRLGLALGDVSGKGMAAALLMAGLQGNLHSRAPRHADGVAQLMAEMNNAMCHVTDVRRYATFTYGIWNDADRSFTYCNAGHNPPFVVSKDRILRLRRGGMVIGMFPDAEYAQETLWLEPDDILVFFTDGASEALDRSGQEFGEESIGEFVRQRRTLSAEELCRQMFDQISSFAGDRMNHDDATLIVAKARHLQEEKDE